MSATVHYIHQDRAIPIIITQERKRAKYIHQVVQSLENEFSLSHKDACYIAIAHILVINCGYDEDSHPTNTAQEIIRNMQ